MDRCPASVTRNLHQQRLPSRRCPASLLIVKNGLIDVIKSAQIIREIPVHDRSSCGEEKCQVNESFIFKI